MIIIRKGILLKEFLLQYIVLRKCNCIIWNLFQKSTWLDDLKEEFTFLFPLLRLLYSDYNSTKSVKASNMKKLQFWPNFLLHIIRPVNIRKRLILVLYTSKKSFRTLGNERRYTFFENRKYGCKLSKNYSNFRVFPLRYVTFLKAVY